MATLSQVQDQVNSYTAAAKSTGNVVEAGMEGDMDALGRELGKAAFTVAGGGIVLAEVQKELGASISSAIMEALL